MTLINTRQRLAVLILWKTLNRSSAIQMIILWNFRSSRCHAFNTLPTEMQNMNKLLRWIAAERTGHIRYLSQMNLPTPGYTCMRRAEWNSLIHMTPLTTAQHQSMLEELRARGGHPWPPRDWTRKPSTSILPFVFFLRRHQIADRVYCKDCSNWRQHPRAVRLALFVWPHA